MKLQHQTMVDASPDLVWAFLQRTDAVVECVPGAELVDQLGDDRFSGLLRVTVGPLKMIYAGEVSVVERDADARRIVIEGSGRDKRGAGGVRTKVRLEVSPAAAGSRISMVSEVDLSGRMASLGRGVGDISNRMFVEFARQLEDQLVQSPTSIAVTRPATQFDGDSVTTSATRIPEGGPSTRRTSEVAGTSEIKVLPLVIAVTRERVADFLERLSVRVRPH